MDKTGLMITTSDSPSESSLLASAASKSKDSSSLPGLWYWAQITAESWQVPSCSILISHCSSAIIITARALLASSPCCTCSSAAFQSALWSAATCLDVHLGQQPHFANQGVHYSQKRLPSWYHTCSPLMFGSWLCSSCSLGLFGGRCF